MILLPVIKVLCLNHITKSRIIIVVVVVSYLHLLFQMGANRAEGELRALADWLNKTTSALSSIEQSPSQAALDYVVSIQTHTYFGVYFLRNLV